MVPWLTDAEKVSILLRCGYPAYGWMGTFDPFGFYFSGIAQAQQQPVMDARVAAVLTQTRAKLAELNALDAAVVGAGDNLDTDQAAVWKRNRAEVQDRVGLLRLRCRELCTLLGVAPGPSLGGAGRRCGWWYDRRPHHRPSAVRVCQGGPEARPHAHAVSAHGAADAGTRAAEPACASYP